LPLPIIRATCPGMLPNSFSLRCPQRGVRRQPQLSTSAAKMERMLNKRPQTASRMVGSRQRRPGARQPQEEVPWHSCKSTGTPGTRNKRSRAAGSARALCKARRSAPLACAQGVGRRNAALWWPSPPPRRDAALRISYRSADSLHPKRTMCCYLRAWQVNPAMRLVLSTVHLFISPTCTPRPRQPSS